MKEKGKIIWGIIAIFLLWVIIIGSICYLIISKNQKISSQTTQVTNLNTGEVVSDNNINLNNYTSNITIKDAGEYTLTGNSKYSVIVDSTGDVTLNLNNATITSSSSGAIIGKNAKSLTINLLKDTKNVVSDGGSSSYDATIYSNAPLIIDGTGKLTVTGNQTDGEGIATETNDMTINNGVIMITSNDDGLNAGGDGGTITINDGTLYIDAKGDGIDSNKDLIINGGTIFVMSSESGGNAGIDTDKGYTVNGGTIVALGTDMIEAPLDTSTQKVMCFTFKDYYGADSIYSLMKNDNEIISFKSTKKFKTMIISTKNITMGTYAFYKDGTDTSTAPYGIYLTKKYTGGTKINTYKVTKTVESYEE